MSDTDTTAQAEPAEEQPLLQLRLELDPEGHSAAYSP
jgi:hypothetical protein